MKDIKGYEGLYAVTRTGQIWSYRRKKFLDPQPRKKDGYVGMSLSKDGKKTNFLLHRIIASAFIPNPLSHPQINHKNGHKWDNRVKNLEWCTAMENIHHAWRTGLMVARRGDENKLTYHKSGSIWMNKHGLFKKEGFKTKRILHKDYPKYGYEIPPCQYGKNSKQVICIETGEIFESVKAAGICKTVEATNISKVLKGKLRTTGGYHWEYYKEGDK